MKDTNASQLAAQNEADLQEWQEFMDLPVSLSIQLGSARMTIQEILALELHGIVQLPRSTSEGVDVVAGGLHIARGEVTMIEDRTGIRVNEVRVSKRTSDGQPASPAGV